MTPEEQDQQDQLLRFLDNLYVEMMLVYRNRWTASETERHRLKARVAELEMALAEVRPNTFVKLGPDDFKVKWQKGKKR